MCLKEHRTFQSNQAWLFTSISGCQCPQMEKHGGGEGCTKKYLWSHPTWALSRWAIWGLRSQLMQYLTYHVWSTSFLFLVLRLDLSWLIVYLIFYSDALFPFLASKVILISVHWHHRQKGKMKGYETKSSDQTDIHMWWWLGGDGYTELAVHCSSICNSNRVETM